MPTFNDLYGKTTKTTDTGGVSFNDFFGLGDDEIKKRLANESRQNLIASTQAQATQADQAVKPNIAANQSLLSQVKRFGPEAAKDAVVNSAKTVGSAVISLPKDIGQQVVNKFNYFTGPTASQRGLPAPNEISDIQQKAQALPADLKSKASRISSNDGLQLLQMVKDGKSNKEIGDFLNQAVAAKTVADKKLAGAAIETASYGIGGGSLAKSFAEGGIRAAAGDILGTGISGAAAGGGGALRTNPNASFKDIFEASVAGGATGIGASILTAGAGQILSKGQKAQNQLETRAILDESRQLPAQATSGAPVITDNAHLLNTGPVDTNLAVRVQGSDTSLLSRLDKVESQITTAQRGGSITAEEARGLMQERNSLIQQIQTGGSKEIKQNLGAAQDVIQTHQTALRTDLNGDFVPRVAQRTEARAVVNGLAGPEGFDNMPTASRLNLEQQANTAVDLVKTDPASARNIAMGVTPPPDGLQATAVYKAVEADAAKKGDAVTLQALATESTIPKQATQAGQFNAALATYDPESPVDVMRQINNIRAKSVNADVPKFVTSTEAEQLTAHAQDVATKREAAIASMQSGNLDDSTRLAYGDARVKLDNYVEALKAPALKTSASQVIKDQGIAGATGRLISNVSGIAKSLRASFDNSAIGRQGLKVLFTHPTVWAKNTLRSFADLAGGFGNKNMFDVLKADIISRPNSLNGMYKQIGADVINITEEAYPSQLPEKIWGIKRPLRASEAAYTGFVQRSRADLADQYIKIAQKAGVDLVDKSQSQPIGKLVNALTGRGYLKHDLNALNNVFFSPRLFKSNVDVLTAHVFQKGTTPFVRKQAAINLLKITAATGVILKIADTVKPGSVELDPRSANFGKIKIGNTRFDVTGGMSSIATLASRLATDSTKSSITGDVSSLTSGKYGAQTALDVLENFTENKLSPATALMKDLLKGQDFNGNPTRTKGYIAKSLLVPLSITNYQELKNDPKSANKLVGTIADGLGISTNTYGKTQNDWRKSTSKELTQFKQSVPEQDFLAANDKYNQQYTSWLDKVNKDSRYNKLSADDRTTVRTNKQNEIRKNVLQDYRFEYTSKPRTDLKGF